jgi:Ni,Fe-hydrogenase I large subunit
LTRIEGHLKIKVEVDSGVVVDAFSSGEMFRGWEIILKGRSPLDAPIITQRICGVCPQVHGTASVLCLDDALGVKPPANGRIIRNLMLGSNFIQSHVLHFYHLSALDFVDITAILAYEGADPKLIQIRDWVKNDIEAGEASAGAPFLPRYEGDYIEDHETNIQSIANYVKALEIRRKAQEMLCIWGGKMPHVQTLFPGGVSVRPTVDKIAAFKSRLAEIQSFIDNVYIPNVLAVAKAYPAWFGIGGGVGSFISYGGFPLDNDNKKLLLASGEFIDGNTGSFDSDEITEHVKHSKFSSGSKLHPSKGETVPDAKKSGAYSWIKSPRYKGKVVEVGPLARTFIAYLKGSNSDLKTMIDSVLADLGAGPEALISTLGRHAARALECKVIADNMQKWADELVPGEPVHNEFKIPGSSMGMGITSGPRGELGHWINIKNKRIANYQAVVPTTWNGGPRDDNGNMGPFEQALMGTPITDPENPIEVGRVIRSFDPCLACAIHIIDNGKEISRFKINT